MKTWEEISALINYDESKVPPYTLPDALLKADGSRVKNAYDWMNSQRPQILELYKRELYGETLPRPDAMRFDLLSEKKDALHGKAVRREIRCAFEMASGKKLHVDLLLYVPREARGRVPVFVGLNFKGNHTVTNERDVAFTGASENSGDDKRGCSSQRMSFEEVISRGYASATACYEDVLPDPYPFDPNPWDKGVFGLLFDERERSGLHERCSMIGAWAWGLSRLADYLETDPHIDAGRMAVHGHSRLGKTALWAGATDFRFGLVISNDSGCGGAALYRRKFGETPLAMAYNFPNWFVAAHEKYVENENAMPFDQHMLIALMAPRPVCVASATEDLWADPRGEYLSAYHAGSVYRLFGAPGLLPEDMPLPDTPLSGAVSYHNRTGKHDQNEKDWSHYLDLADRALK